MQSWTIQPVANPWVLSLVAFALAFLVLLGPRFRTLPAGRRWSLSGLRTVVIGLALLASFRPGCVQTIERTQSASVIFLADTSRSMELPHREDTSTRFGALKQMLSDNKPLFDQLAEHQISVRYYGFDNQVTELKSESSSVSLPVEPHGAETDIGRALMETALGARDQRLIGVFLASDGVPNVLDPKVELTQAAEILDEMSVPLYAVPFGMPGDSGQVADIAVISLAEQHRVAVKNQLTVEPIVSARGFANQVVTVQLFITDSDGQQEQVSTQFVPDKSYVEQKVPLRYVPSEPGQFRLRVRAFTAAEELAVRNNELPSFLNVYEGGIRVLYLDGQVGWEQSFLRRAISTAAQGVELIPITVYSDEQSRSRWPLGEEITQWFRDPTIDVFIIGDVDSRALYDRQTQSENLRLLEQAVDQGKGLLMLGGQHSFGPGLYHSTPLDDVLPIEMNLDERQDFPPAATRRDLHINEPVKLVPAKDHFITRISADLDYETAWQALPPLLGANRFVGVKDTAEVLLKSEFGNPILVSGRLGGRVLAFAGDSTWKWVMQGYEQEFKQFWRQVLLWLAFQDGRQNNNVWVDLPQRRFQPGSVVSFFCRASDSNGALIDDATFSANLISPNKNESVVAVDPAGKQGIVEELSLVEPGIYQIKLSASRNGTALGESVAEFVVVDQDKEKAIPAADPEQMASLAAQTKKHGGRVVLPEDLGSLLAEMNMNPPETIELPLKWQLGQTTGDSLAFLSLFTILLGLEWVLRKKWGLV